MSAWRLRGGAPRPEPTPALVGDKEKTRRVFAELAERDAERLEAERRAAMAPAAAFSSAGRSGTRRLPGPGC